MHIDFAKYQDLPKVIDLIMHLNDNYGFNDFPSAKRECVENTVRANFERVPCFVVKDGDEIVGLSSLALSNYGWTDEMFITPFVTYILPDHRNIAIVKRLYNAIKKYAELQGMLLVDTHLAMERVDGRRRLLQSLGFKEDGFLMTYKGN